MSSEEETHLTADRVAEAIAAMEHEHPRKILVLCCAADLATVEGWLSVIHLPDTELSAKAHKYCEAGRMYIMRHPDDYEPIARLPFEFMAVGGGFEPGEPESLSPSA